MEHGPRTRIGRGLIPLSFAPGEAYQFDWSHEVVVLNGVTDDGEGGARPAVPQPDAVRAGAIRARRRRWCSTRTTGPSRFFKGTCRRGIYDNMKTAVDTIFVGKERVYNRRFLQMCSHYLVDPVACTPASGWEKGQVENQVGWCASGSSRPGCEARATTS